MSELYKAIAGSPITYLAGDISAAQTTIAVADDTALPDAPNICTIGYGENLETIKYETKSNGVLQNVTRGIEGTARAWPAGTEVARFFTAYDHNSIIENFNSLINKSPTLESDHIDLGVAKIQYGSVSLTTDGSGNVSLNSPFPVTFSSDVKTFVVSQFSGAGVARVKGGNVSLANFSISLEGGTANSTYVCKWLAIGV